jgi:hypothetical protein
MFRRNNFSPSKINDLGGIACFVVKSTHLRKNNQYEISEDNNVRNKLISVHVKCILYVYESGQELLFYVV